MNRTGDERRQQRGLDLPTRGCGNSHARQHVLQLTRARPVIAREGGENAVGQRRLRSHARRCRTADVISERHDVFGTLAQRRHTMRTTSRR